MAESYDETDIIIYGVTCMVSPRKDHYVNLTIVSFIRALNILPYPPRVAEFQSVMADLYLQQAEADEMLYFLAMDYRQGISSEHQVVNKIGLQEDPGSCGPGLGQAEKGAQSTPERAEKKWE